MLARVGRRARPGGARSARRAGPPPAGSRPAASHSAEEVAMKPTNPMTVPSRETTRKLELSRETLRNLSAPQAGGPGQHPTTTATTLQSGCC